MKGVLSLVQESGNLEAVAGDLQRHDSMTTDF